METVLGHLKCVEIKDNEDGTSTIIFDANPEFKQKYMELYKLEEWSQEHFENQVKEALESFIETYGNKNKQSAINN